MHVQTSETVTLQFWAENVYLFPDGASCCHCAPVVGTGAWVPLGYLLPILPPLASVIHLTNNPKHVYMLFINTSVHINTISYTYMYVCIEQALDTFL